MKDYETTLKPCPYCGIGTLRRSYGIRASIEECTNCDQYLVVQHNQSKPDPEAGIPLYNHKEVDKNESTRSKEEDVR